VEDIATREKKEHVAILNNIICRDRNSTNIVAKAERKDYNIVFDKRVIRENYTTAPYGMYYCILCIYIFDKQKTKCLKNIQSLSLCM
jgi:hypothetical protein